MADNLVTTTTVATIPNATTIRTDDLGVAGHVQYVKLMDGANNGTDPIGGDAANGLDVDVTRVGGTVTVANGGTFAVQAAQSGTWTVQPGNTANTTAWKVDGTGGVFPVTGTFWQATQPVSAAALPLPTGAATSAKQPALGTAGSSSADVISVQGIASGTALKVDGSAVTQPVSGTFWQATQPVSAASLPLPSGASTAAKQPALGTAGSASADVITVQGVTSMTPLKVDGSGVTQPVSIAGTVTVTGGGGGTQFAEDAVHVSGDLGTEVLAKRTDVPAVSSGTDGDYSTFNVDADGKLWVNSGTVRVRKLWVASTITASTSETTIVAAVASESHDLFGISLTNTGTSATKVSLRDDTAGTVKQVLFVPAGSTVGWMLPVDSAIPQTAQNKNWTATCGTSTSSLEVTAFYLKVT